MEKYTIAPPAGSTQNSVGAEDRPWKEGHFETLVADDVVAKGPVVDVRVFGAVGDGVTDDTAAIQAAIDNNPHCIIYFPTGTYLISDSITTSANESDKVILHLGGSEIKASDNYPTTTDKYMLEIGYIGADVGDSAQFSNTVRCGIINGNNRAYGGLRTQKTHLAKFANLTIDNITDIGMEILPGGDGGSSDAYIDEILLKGCHKPGSIGLLIRGNDNNISKVRTGWFPIGIKIMSNGNYLTECHPLWYSNVIEGEDGLGEVAFWIYAATETTLQNCYSDAFATCIYADTSYPVYVHNFWGLYTTDHPSKHNTFYKTYGRPLSAYIYNAHCEFIDDATFDNKASDCVPDAVFPGCGFYDCRFVNVTYEDNGVSSQLVHCGDSGITKTSKTRTGYVEFTNGFIIQWGVLDAADNVTGETWIGYPIPFKNFGVPVFCSQSGTYARTASAGTLELSGFTAVTFNGTTVQGNVQVTWVAFGY